MPGDLGQQMDIEDVREQVERMRNEHALAQWDTPKLKELGDRVLELGLRHGLLVRLLIAKGLITAEEYAHLIAEARAEPVEESRPLPVIHQSRARSGTER